MARNVRLADVAKAAGVSPATVSRALSQPELLSRDTLLRVRTHARLLGYHPHGAARALASGRSMTIGAVMPALDNPIFSRALQSMQTALAGEGYQLLVASHNYSAAAETDAVRTLLARGVDGLMLVGAERAADTSALLDEAGIPVVLTWRTTSRHAGVTVDNERAGRLAAPDLVERGHVRIGMVSGRFTFNDRQRARMAGARAFLAEAGRGLPDWMISEQPTTLAGGRAGCASLLELGEPPTALIGGIDLLAIGCMVEAQARGLNVPHDLSVAGIDDIDMSAHLSPSLTTVHIPTAQIGRDAARALLSMIAGTVAEEVLDLPVELVVRRSTGPAKASASAVGRPADEDARQRRSER